MPCQHPAVCICVLTLAPPSSPMTAIRLPSHSSQSPSAPRPAKPPTREDGALVLLPGLHRLLSRQLNLGRRRLRSAKQRRAGRRRGTKQRGAAGGRRGGGTHCVAACSRAAGSAKAEGGCCGGAEAEDAGGRGGRGGGTNRECAAAAAGCTWAVGRGSEMGAISGDCAKVTSPAQSFSS